MVQQRWLKAPRPHCAKLGQSLLKQQTSEFTLPNDLHFIMLEQHTAPGLSCHTYTNVDAFEEVDGQTGDPCRGFAHSSGTGQNRNRSLVSSHRLSGVCTIHHCCEDQVADNMQQTTNHKGLLPGYQSTVQWFNSLCVTGTNAVRSPEGVTFLAGLAHMLEHEAFKGSERIGTRDWAKDAPLLEAQDEGTAAS